MTTFFTAAQNVRYWPLADMGGGFPSAGLNRYDAVR
jgi:hypothetical protein